MSEAKIRAAEIERSRELLAEVSALWTKNFTDEDHQITSDITPKLLEITETGAFSLSPNAKFFHLGEACLTLARGFSEREMLAAASA